MAGAVLTLGPNAMADTSVRKYTEDAACTLYRAVNGTPERNLNKIIDMMGGIEKLIGAHDVVLIKTNAQWWNQGSPNLSALKAFVDMIMERPGGFFGEVVVVENCHRGKSPWTSKGSAWANTFQRNSDVPGVKNLNGLCMLLKEKYDSRFSTVHWIDISHGGKRVYSPADGGGYVYCDGTGGIPLITCDNGAKGRDLRSTIMTYPIFLTDKGTRIDFKHSIWKDGSYTGQPLRFINFAALNHHSTYCGATSAVKNYMGITDLSGGPDPHNDGLLTDKYYNFHSFPLDKWAPGPRPGMLGKEMGVFMKTIRKADLNVTTAEWVGLSSRTHPPVAHTRAVIASTDPVALDYHAAKYILYPNSGISLHDPENKNSPLHQYLVECTENASLIFDEEKVKVISYNFQTDTFQKDDQLVINSQIKWGRNAREIMKYLYLRYVI